MKEPSFGFRNVIKARKEGKVKAYFSVLVPTENIGTLEIAGFKVVEGKDGCFVSLPNRAIKVPTKPAITPDGGTVEGSTGEEIKYYNNLQFESLDKYKQFRDAMNKEVLPLVLKKIEA